MIRRAVKRTAKVHIDDLEEDGRQAAASSRKVGKKSESTLVVVDIVEYSIDWPHPEQRRGEGYQCIIPNYALRNLFMDS